MVIAVTLREPGAAVRPARCRDEHRPPARKPAMTGRCGSSVMDQPEHARDHHG